MTPSQLARRLLAVSNINDVKRIEDGTITKEELLFLVSLSQDVRDKRGGATSTDYYISLGHLATSLIDATWDRRWINYDTLNLRIAYDYYYSYMKYYKRHQIGMALSHLFRGNVSLTLVGLSRKNIPFTNEEMEGFRERAAETIGYAVFSITLPIYLSLYSFIDGILRDSDTLIDLAAAYLDEIGPTII